MFLKYVRRIALALTALALICAPALAEFEMELPDYLGEPVEDFTVETIDGGAFTLSEALEDHDMVLINLWASWCGPCEQEFPMLQEAYEAYADRVAVIALSVEPEDTKEVLAEYAEAHGLTFPIASDTAGLADAFQAFSIPLTVVVDRFGNAAYSVTGSQTSVEAFTRLFDAFLGDDYTETEVLTELPAARPDAEPADGAALSAAANAGGGALSFRNAEDDYTWPMLPVEADGRTALVSTNEGHMESVAAVYVTVNASAGDALAFDFRTSTEAAMDLLEIGVDGEPVKAFGGEHDWTTWAVALGEGEHEVAFTYAKDEIESAGEDRVWLDEVRLVSGEEAAALLEALPAAPAAEALSVTVAGPGVVEVLLEDPEGVIEGYFSCESCWLVPGDALDVEVALPPDADDERAFVYSFVDGSIHALSRALKPDGSGYALSLDMRGFADVEEGYSAIRVYRGLRDEEMEDIRGLMLFRDADAIDGLVSELAEEDVELHWLNPDAAPGGAA